jgi:hypothetical protein
MMVIIEGLMFMAVGMLVIFIVLKAIKGMTGDDDADQS